MFRFAKLSAAAVLATFVWIKEYGFESSAGRPIYHWWLSDGMRFLNSFASSFIDYAYGFVGFVFAVTRDPAVMQAMGKILVTPVSLKESINSTFPLDAWRFFQWDNRLSNWLGHFVFTLLVVWMVFAILRWDRLSWLRIPLAVALLLPFAGIFVGQVVLLP